MAIELWAPLDPWGLKSNELWKVTKPPLASATSGLAVEARMRTIRFLSGLPLAVNAR